MTLRPIAKTGLRLRSDWRPERQSACAVLDAYDGPVAAEKSRSWEVVKWATAINAALAIVSIALNKPRDGSSG